MQTNENHPNRKRIRNFFREKGYYIVLALCVCAVGVSGWLFVSGAIAEKKALRQETMSIATSAEDPAKNPSARTEAGPDRRCGGGNGSGSRHDGRVRPRGGEERARLARFRQHAGRLQRRRAAV